MEQAWDDERVQTDLDEFVACPPGGRQIARTRRVRLGDVTASGRIRLDALARYLQDIAADDVDDAGIVGAWVVRRMALRFGELPRFRDDVELSTFCSGTGSRWAERRTTVRVAEREGSADPAPIEAVAIWVYVDASGRPARLEEWFWDLYGTAANDRIVSGRLHHRPPPADAVARPWPLRRADLDVLDHVNNAVSWAAVEDALDESGGRRRLSGAEIEYRAPIDAGETPTLHTVSDGDRLACWLTVEDEVRTSAVLTFA